MQTKNLIVLALVGVVVLTGALIVATARKAEKDAPAAVSNAQKVYPIPTAAAPSGTLSGASAQASVQIVADNVQTSVQVP